MSILLAVVVLLATLVGLSLGLLGGGGSILTVPLLTYVAGMDAKEAIAASLFVVGTTSVVSTIAHARRGNVQWRTGLIFGVASMAGAFLGGLLGGFIPSVILMLAFALMMIATATAMLRGRKQRADTGEKTALPLGKILAEGLAVGLVTGLVGAGGGFLVVPALALLGGLPMPVAVGTSLLVISMKSFAGLAGYMTSVSLDWPLVLAVTGAALVGALIGARLTSVVPEQALRKGFGVFVLVMGVFILYQELPAPWGLVVVGVAALLAVAAFAYRRLTPAPQPVSS
ncbi:hypothetical protein HMPREF0290_0486 [Corynebacterium efficiens YS-314]|uniref:Probable membrane transporter protein n=1 Tax=Corynebacterium efficiens (strain DSM 44549 / YS-314 / AJ 12310 / JCM 11189 / NBRC 100395) TaxID=196164 RepID=Q8FSR5_COREF|nr:sulfite exporter TauE/SafE family protein [Corynebacterium efficiens]EEW50906.1 hypothetical protein HMPREF0290_0486 [Corynebacterium efficiens YS-314]BAC17127.1 conserved hypothetical protein [Corynebacterium efficiens YS-314]